MDKELQVLIDAVRAAGDEAANMRKQGVDVTYKDNRELLTQADLRVNEILQSKLLSAFPNDSWLSEESVDDPVRLQAERVWVVDPIDGTIEYANGIPEYAVSVALVVNGKATVACVYNPDSGQLFSAAKGQGAMLNGERVTCSDTCSEKLTLLASRSEFKRGEWDSFSDHDVKVVGSIAYKLALVAAGLADATFSLGPKHEWDIAAGVLLVEEAGGVVVDKDDKEFIFNQQKVKVNGIIACSQAAIGQLRKLIAVA